MQPASKITSDDDWQLKATENAIAAARRVVAESVNSRAMVSSLSEIEWGWIVCAAIFGWIETKAQQAVYEGRSYDETIQAMPGEPGPWEAGAVASILPALGHVDGLDWAKPVGEWSKEQIINFIWQCHKLADAALAQRDEGAADVVTHLNRAVLEREVSAANGGPLMDRAELDKEIPF